MDPKSDLPPIDVWTLGDNETVSREKREPHREWAAPVARYARHLTALLVVVAGVALSQVKWAPPASEAAEETEPQVRASKSLVTSRGGSRITDDEALALAGMVHTDLAEHTQPPTPIALPSPTQAMLALEISSPSPEPTEVVARTEIITYVVQAGDIVGTIARKFDISEDTLCWANGRLADNPDYLRVGQHLYILPIDGVLHIVEKGDTLEAIAKAYKAKVEDIIAFEPNGLSESPILIEEQALVVPKGSKPYVPRTVVAWQGTSPKGAKEGTGAFVWPATGVLTQKFWAQHQAIDIGWSEGTPVIASDAGYVCKAGNDPSGYGRYVIIDHGNGFQTLYSHFKVYYVEVGQSVSKGATIGLMGSTGRSTGPHLHFEIRKNGVKVNPLNYLP